MKCNACWKNLEGRAVATTCGHIFCTEDAEKILSTVDATCPLCEQMLSESKTKAVDMAPTEEWINDVEAYECGNACQALFPFHTRHCHHMVLAGVAPQSIMKSAFKGVVFWIGQKDVEVQLSVNKALQFRQKCEQMQAVYTQKISQVEEAYSAKLQQVHSGCQKALKKIQGLEQERETTLKDKKEIQEKYTEKSRQKRKLEEMYDALRKEHELLIQRSAASSTPNNQVVIQRPNPYAFAPTFKGFDDLRHQPSGLSGMPANSPAGGAEFWPPRQETQPAPFDMPSVAASLRSRRQGSRNSPHQPFSGGSPTMFNRSAAAQPSDTFRNLLRSPSTRRRPGRPRGL